MRIIIKRLFDIVFSLILSIIISPFCIIISCIIYFTMGSPVFFIQSRIGLRGKPFNIIKFRSMIAEEHPNTISINGDSKITKFGVIIRKYKIDEIPELINVLLGEMSFVGPRPDVPGYADLLVGENRKILELRPGITGPASLKYANEELLLANIADPINFNNTVIYPDKVRINLDYYYNHSLWLDIKIIFDTIIRKPHDK